MAPPRPSRSIGFPLVCALAYAGGVIGYLPLLTLLLPMQVARVAGEDRFAVLAQVLVVGAIAAGSAGVLFGWLSDRSRARGGGRRRWIVGGLIGTVASFALFPAAHTPLAIILAIVVFQVALNAALGPMMALVAEEVPDSQTSLTTGMFAAGAPIASLFSLLLAVPAFHADAARLALIGAAAAACLTPLILSTPRRPTPVAPSAEPATPRRNLVVASLARLIAQVAGTVLFADLLYLMEEPGDGAAAIERMGSLMIAANLAPLPVSILVGRWSDRLGRRKLALVALAVAATAGLLVMVAATDWTGRAAGFVLFSIGWNAFLSLQVGYIMRLLPDPRRRGRDLGLVNLTNTLPVLVGQGLAWSMATPHHAGPLLLTLAGLMLAGGLTMIGVHDRG